MVLGNTGTTTSLGKNHQFKAIKQILELVIMEWIYHLFTFSLNIELFKAHGHQKSKPCDPVNKTFYRLKMKNVHLLKDRKNSSHLEKNYLELQFLISCCFSFSCQWMVQARFKLSKSIWWHWLSLIFSALHQWQCLFLYKSSRGTKQNWGDSEYDENPAPTAMLRKLKVNF